MIHAFKENYGHCTSPKVELLALLSGLRMAQELGARSLIVMVDSKLVEGWLNKELPSCYPYLYLIRECKMMFMEGNWSVQAHHCYREVNRAVDWLAN